MYEVCRSSKVYKTNSIICDITTAYPSPEISPAYAERCMLVDMYEGKIPYNDRYFCALFELDEGDDYGDKNVWGKANPLFVQFPQIMDRLENDYKSALNDPEKLLLFRTKNLNQWIGQNSNIAYLDFDEWKKCQVDKVDFNGREVVVGIDMSKTTDLTGVSIMSKDRYGNVMLKSKAFLPRETIAPKEISDKIPYNAYVQQHPEWIHATEGKFVNQTEVENYIRNIEDMYNCKIKCIAFDSWNAMHLMSSLSDDYEVIDVKMNFKTFSSAGIINSKS